MYRTDEKEAIILNSSNICFIPVQVMHFIVGHSDVFHSIMRDRQPELNLHSLQELALTTAVVARANCFGKSAYCNLYG